VDTSQQVAGGADRAAQTVTDSYRGLFVRRSSGLVRELGARDAYSFAVNFTNVGALPFGILLALALFPGVDVAWPFVLVEPSVSPSGYCGGF